MKSRKNLSDQELYIAKRLRDRRLEMGFSQTTLAEYLGVSTQQIHKYEKGIDRIFAGRLLDLSLHLQVPLTFFYEGIDEFATQSKELLVTCADERGKFILKFQDQEGIISNIKVLQTKSSHEKA